MLENLKSELTIELHQLLNWWKLHSVDIQNGGFYGKIDNNNLVAQEAPKGLVLNARILYTFSSAYRLDRNIENLNLATRAYAYINAHFLDQINGGFYWSLDFKGEPLNDKKQVYGQAFVIYALAEYYKITQEEKALALAISTFQILEKYSFDKKNLGYIEALTKTWQPIADLRLSEKDQNEKKSMNTHLHVIEAYSNLYSVWKNDDLKEAIRLLLSNFSEYIIDANTKHLRLFFTETWKSRSTAISFGHDIEAAWLLQEAAETIGDENEIAIFKKFALQLADATLQGIDKNGGLYTEFDPSTNHWNRGFHWWPQAEAMVGFFNAYQISHHESYLEKVSHCWSFIKDHFKDNKNGEWFWGVNEDYSTMTGEDKAGFWKCPYHNGRACIEMIKRIGSI